MDKALRKLARFMTELQIAMLAREIVAAQAHLCMDSRHVPGSVEAKTARLNFLSTCYEIAEDAIELQETALLSVLNG